MSVSQRLAGETPFFFTHLNTKSKINLDNIYYTSMDYILIYYNKDDKCYKYVHIDFYNLI